MHGIAILFSLPMLCSYGRIGGKRNALAIKAEAASWKRKWKLMSTRVLSVASLSARLWKYGVHSYKTAIYQNHFTPYIPGHWGFCSQHIKERT